jgi:hypothetical protein
MKEINQRLFSRLGEVAKKVAPQDLLNFPRAIATDPNGKSWLQNAKVKKSPHLVLGPKAQFAIVELENSCFLAAVGVEIAFPLESDMRQIELNSGAFTLLATELDVPLNDSDSLGYELLENVFIPAESKSDKFVLLPMEVVDKYFAKISLFEVRNESSLLSDNSKDYRIALAAVLCANAARPLAWSSTTLERLSEMAMDKDEKAPFHLLFRMLTESRGDAAFLAVYRCIEQLFPLPKIATLCNELGVTMPAMQVAKSLEQHLGWRRPEIESLTQIMASVPPSLLDQLKGFFTIAADIQDPAQAIAKAIYDLRNRCVHFRALHAAEYEAPLPDWLTLSDMLLELVQFLYKENADAFDV